jgi:hypothetical protein
MEFISCETANDKFGKTEQQCNNGDVSIDWLQNANINTQNRAYQREKVAKESWKQAIMRTVLVDSYAGIPEIHIRVLKTEGKGWKFELIDGQQRITAILDFLSNEYPLPNDMIFKTQEDSFDISGLNVKGLRNKFPAIWETLSEYRISCKWYEDLSDLQTAHLFIEVLNNVNDMKPQEIRNAILGFYSDYVRDTARFEPHELFTRTTTKVKNTEKQNLKYFSSSFSLSGRMEVDEFLSELLYLHFNDVKKGISHLSHKRWVENIQKAEGDYASSFTAKKKADELLNFTLSILKVVPDTFKVKLNSMTTMMLVLYAKDLCARFGDVNRATYAKAFFKTYTLWSDTNKQLYRNETTINNNQMPPFNELFGGKNGNAIQTIFKVLDIELEKGEIDFGIIKLDLRKSFKKADIVRKWQEQEGKCAITELTLTEDNIAGDHIIPRSAGIVAGGVTEYDNLQVIGKLDNIKKSNMSNEVYKEKVRLTKVTN